MKPRLHIKQPGTNQTYCARDIDKIHYWTLPGLQRAIVWKGLLKCSKCLTKYGISLITRGDDVL